MRYWDVFNDGHVLPAAADTPVPEGASRWVLPDNVTPSPEETVLADLGEDVPPVTGYDFRFPDWEETEARAIARQALLEALDAMASVVLKKYPEAERASWAVKVVEAQKILASQDAPPPVEEIPTLVSEVAAAHKAGRTDVTLLSLAQAVLSAAPVYAAFSGTIAGFRSATEARLAQAGTMAEMQTILSETMESFRMELSKLGVDADGEV